MQIELKYLDSEKTYSISISEEEIQSYQYHGTCPICETECRPEALARLGRHGSESQLEIGQCKECEAIYYLNPPSSKQIDFYYQNLWNKARGERLDSAPKLAISVRRKISQILSDLKLPKGLIRILDVGCGFGSMLAGLQEAGYTNIYGLEQSKYRVTLSEKRFPGRIFGGGYASHDPRQKYDVIYCNHVLEHIHRPSDYIRWVNENLSKNGIAIICVPNQEWEQVVNQMFFLPHLHSMSAFSLVKLADVSGFSVRFWMKSERRDEICVVCFRGDVNLNWDDDGPFVECHNYTGIALTSQKERFRSIWTNKNQTGRLEKVINWPASNHLAMIKNPKQRWNSYTVWPSIWRHLFRLLLFRRRLSLRYGSFLNRGQGFLNQLLSSSDQQITDYDYLGYKITGESGDGVPEISYHSNAILLIK